MHKQYTSNMTGELLESVEETVAWAAEVIELWTGTLHAEYIDYQRVQLMRAVDREDYDNVQKLLYDLAETLCYAEREYERESH